MIRTWAVDVEATRQSDGERGSDIELVKARSKAAAKRVALKRVGEQGFGGCKVLSCEPYEPWGETCGDAATATGMYDRY